MKVSESHEAEVQARPSSLWRRVFPGPGEARDLLVVAGEASGDRAAASVLAELKGVRAFGMGGLALAGAGAELTFDLRSLTALGIGDVVARAGPVAQAYRAVTAATKVHRPWAALLVNYSEFNLRLAAKLKSMLNHLGCEEHLLPTHLYLGKKIPIAGTAHQCGTVRFGRDPKTSVLDVHCKAHDLDNLYVVDASFFVSSSAVNPSLTIIANALRVGDHLLSRLA